MSVLLPSEQATCVPTPSYALRIGARYTEARLTITIEGLPRRAGAGRALELLNGWPGRVRESANDAWLRVVGDPAHRRAGAVAFHLFLKQPYLLCRLASRSLAYFSALRARITA